MAGAASSSCGAASTGAPGSFQGRGEFLVQIESLPLEFLELRAVSPVACQESPGLAARARGHPPGRIDDCQRSSSRRRRRRRRGGSGCGCRFFTPTKAAVIPREIVGNTRPDDASSRDDDVSASNGLSGLLLVVVAAAAAAVAVCGCGCFSFFSFSFRFFFGHVSRERQPPSLGIAGATTRATAAALRSGCDRSRCSAPPPPTRRRRSRSRRTESCNARRNAKRFGGWCDCSKHGYCCRCRCYCPNKSCCCCCCCCSCCRGLTTTSTTMVVLLLFLLLHHRRSSPVVLRRCRHSIFGLFFCFCFCFQFCRCLFFAIVTLSNHSFFYMNDK